MVRGVWRAGATGVVLLALIAACRQLVGIGDETPTQADAPDAGPACGIRYAGTACEACLESQCCAPARDCAGSQSCKTLEDCLGSCNGDATCRAKCTFDHLIGADQLESNLASCLASSCAGQCNLTCGGLAALEGPDAARGCEACMVNNPTVCSAAQACANESHCQALKRCWQTNHTQDTMEDCEKGHLAGQTASDDLFNALLSPPCENDCAVGREWFCVGHSSTAGGNGIATAVTVHVYDKLSTNGRPIQGVTVQVCNEGDPTCGGPDASVPTATTDADGGATIQVPQNPQGGGSRGYLQLQGGGIAPTLSYWGFQLTQPTLFYNLGVVTPAEVQAFASQIPGADPSAPAVVVAVSDCSVWYAPDVSLSISPDDGGVKLVYLQGLQIASTDATTATGVGVFVNAPAGYVTITATPKALGRPSSVVQVFTRAGWVTETSTPPNQ